MSLSSLERAVPEEDRISPDALTIATGITAQVGHLITNDAQWQRLQPISQRIRVCYLAEHVPFPH